MPFQPTSSLPILLGRPVFRYSPTWSDCSIIHRINEVIVVGDPHNASYEWVIAIDNKIIAHSDAGYGESMAALRDGLVAYFDTSDPKTIRQLAQEFADQARRAAGNDDVKITVTVTSERETTSIERRDAASLEREGVSMRNVRGEWITKKP